MDIRFNRLVMRDVQEIRDYYTGESGPDLAAEFFAELMRTLAEAARHPRRFHPDGHGARRANLERFPYHFRYRIRQGFIYVLVVRHHKRHPSFGLRRH